MNLPGSTAALARRSSSYLVLAFVSATLVGCPSSVAPDGGAPWLDGGTGAGDGGSRGAGGDGGDGVGESDAGAEGCIEEDLTDPGAPDRDRVVLVGHPFAAAAGQQGTDVRALTLRVEGGLDDDGVRIDVGFRPARIEFVPSGKYALVLGEDGELASLRVGSSSELEVVDQVTLPPAGYGDLRVRADGSEVVVAGSNSVETGGVSVVRVACDGSLTVVEGAFFPLRLADSFAFLPGEERLVLLGGQAVFAPVDDNDVRLLVRSGDGFSEIGAFDLYGDFIDAMRIAVSPDGSTLLVPNGSPFSDEGGQVLVARIDGDSVTESHRIQDLSDVREALFSPDGATALVTLLEPGKVVVLSDQGAGLVVTSELSGIGLAEHMAPVQRGALSGTVLVTSVGQHGELTTLRVTAPGVAEELGALDLGPGGENLPGSVAVMR